MAQELQRSGLYIFVSLKQLSSACHVSSIAALDTDHKHKFSLTYLIYFSYLSDSLTDTPKIYGSRPWIYPAMFHGRVVDQDKSHLSHFFDVGMAASRNSIRTMSVEMNHICVIYQTTSWITT